MGLGITSVQGVHQRGLRRNLAMPSTSGSTRRETVSFAAHPAALSPGRKIPLFLPILVALGLHTPTLAKQPDELITARQGTFEVTGACPDKTGAPLTAAKAGSRAAWCKLGEKKLIVTDAGIQFTPDVSMEMDIELVDPDSDYLNRRTRLIRVKVEAGLTPEQMSKVFNQMVLEIAANQIQQNITLPIPTFFPDKPDLNSKAVLSFAIWQMFRLYDGTQAYLTSLQGKQQKVLFHDNDPKGLEAVLAQATRKMLTGGFKKPDQSWVMQGLAQCTELLGLSDLSLKMTALPMGDTQT